MGGTFEAEVALDKQRPRASTKPAGPGFLGLG
jgi:hypothetical protein